MEAAAHSAQQPLQQHVGVVTETERAQRHSAVVVVKEETPTRTQEFYMSHRTLRETECDSAEASVSIKAEAAGGLRPLNI